ncbi:GEVED domain-containing protein [Hahella aquimaris]|uniref:PEP-CTERM sorting domain-containing protein n=1 Tax=Hahella sp. HNIBRBA332 TaxID=3015983 RepID=UPI00273C9A48|nr:PEP-CTERM sorting domain-containing protein [Hahella sp. HNIBRBA332]WLQ12494.1 GEVED domain-containing protein [Hahella sp. HNIBRBA332]
MKKLAFLASLPLMLGAASAYAIPASYGTTTHDTTAWQELADAPNGDSYGVSWTTDGGASWGRNDLTVGQTVQFKFSVHKKNVGTHYADLMKAWIDWDQNGVFDASDEIAYGEHKLTDFEPVLGMWQAPTNPDFSFFSSEYTLTNADVGDFWLRSIVTCSHSITNMYGGTWNDQWKTEYTGSYEDRMTPTGHYYQGETEEWKISVHSVPEPTTFALLGLGLIGLVARKRAK